MLDRILDKYYAMAEPDFDWKKEPGQTSSKFKFNYPYLIEHLAGTLEGTYYKIHDIYLRVTSSQRGSRLIIALRRYKNKNGHWPKGLDNIKSLAPAEAFIDPQNGGAFVYKLTEENFALYSKGKNNIDENGEYKDGADDWLIWPPRGYKTEKKNADAE